MPCKFCGVQWKKDVSDDELSAEIARRAKVREEYAAEQRTRVEAAKSRYFDRVWPAYTHATFLMIASLIAAMFATAFTTSLIGPVLYEHLGAFGEPATLLASFVVFLVVFSPGIAVIMKERRLLADFRKEYPEFFESL